MTSRATGPAPQPPPRTPPGLATPGLALPHYAPRRYRTPGGIVTIGLLRHLHPARLVLPGSEPLAYDDWLRHGRQAGTFVLVATRPTGELRQVLGTLELSVEETDRAARRILRGMIDRVFVLPEFRRLGLGTQLLAAAIGFARDNGLAALREYIPAVLVRAGGPAGGAPGWAFHTPDGEELGGLRSLGATAKACAQERQRCQVVRLTGDPPTSGGEDGDGRGREPPERLGVVLELPVGAPGGPESGAALLARLRGEIAELAARGCPAGAAV